MDKGNKNYLPFVQRSISTAVNSGKGTQTKAETRIGAFTLGFEERAILGDLCIRFSTTGPFADPNTAARYVINLGWYSKGYLLDYPLPLGTFVNRRRGYASVWKFPKPFTMYPGERLRARMVPSQGGAYEYPRGIMFNGVRHDGRPHMLYDASENVAAAGVAQMAGDGLVCPDDCPIDLYSVSVDEFQRYRNTSSFILQVSGPGSREWFKYDLSDQTAAAPTANWFEDCWIAPPVSYIELGEKHGWVMESDDSLIVDVVDLEGAAFSVQTTLRGSLEVDREPV